ncbi:MAG: NADPH:quinone oxidoreductase family protein [Acidimicrobiales bacterium]|jgi:NADPH2:quinone reductase|nr:NADPH:quinone oxidoreductase family protein [Acidimicrobiales bacterium]
MRAWQVHRNAAPRDALRLVEIDEPEPGPGELRLRVHAAAIGMPDAFLCRGRYAFRPPIPFVPGQEVCGTVDAVGEGVETAVGTRLMAVTSFYDGRGGFADATVARADTAFRVPDAMSDTSAAAFRIGYSTAWIGLVRRGGLRAGERLLVLGGAGGSGTAAIEVGRALGASVIAVVGGAEKEDLCRRLGAEVVIDRTEVDVPEAVRGATGGAGVDVVYDPVGGAAADAVAGCLRPGGRLLAVGFASGTWARPDTAALVRSSASLVGVYAGGGTRDEDAADHEALLGLFADGRLTVAVTPVPFGSLPDAVARVDAGTAVGKLVVEVG